MLIVLVEDSITHRSIWIKLPMETVILDEILSTYAPVVKSFITNVKDIKIHSYTNIFVLNFIMQMLTGFKDSKNRFDEIRLDTVKLYFKYDFKTE